MCRNRKSIVWLRGGRRSLLIVVGICVAIRLIFIAGWVRPIRVESGSMAPTLYGRHFRPTCDDCQFSFAVDAAQSSVHEPVVCPNCGYRQTRCSESNRRKGNRVVIDRFAFVLRMPRRLEVVAIRQANGRLLTKRVIGLPGEWLGFVDGDLTINRVIERKSLRQLRDQMILIHDSSYVPGFAGSATRWTPQEDSNWNQVGLGWGVETVAIDDNKNQRQWLEYRHRCAYSDSIPPKTRTDEVPVCDDYPYNSDIVRGQLHQVPDVLLEFDAHWSSDSVIFLRWRSKSVECVAELHMKTGWVILSRQGKVILRRQVHLPPANQRKKRIEWGMFDRRLVLAVNRRELISAEIYLPVPAGSHSRPVAIACKNGQIQISRLRLFRDLYYFGPDPTRNHWRARTAQTGLFFAGDNLPASIDNRFQTTRVDTSGKLFGRVVPLHSAEL